MKNTTLLVMTTVMLACVAMAQERRVAGPGDAPLADFQSRLLDLAMETATAIPVKPHIKDRSRTQAEVVEASLALDQPRRASRYLEQIRNWRKGAACGDLAFYCADRGYADEARHYAGLAEHIAERAEEWRRDRIRVKIARTYARLGANELARTFEADLVPAETGKVEAVRVRLIDDETFNQQVATLDETIDTGNFDLVRNALEAYVQLFDRFYGRPQRRDLAEAKIRASWSNIPLMVRIELLGDLAAVALEHQDPRKARTLVDDAGKILQEYTWTPEHRIPMVARMAELRHGAGQTERARADADAALAAYDAGDRDRIVNIFRGRALRPLAEAYVAMGAVNEALALYKRIVEEGLVNPNSRPRAEDLAATCCSLAVHRLEPDGELWDSIDRASAMLGDPW